MRTRLALTMAVLLFGSTQAVAQEGAASYSEGGGSASTGIGVGAEATLTGLAGAALVYQAESFRIDGVLGLQSRGDTDIALAGRFWYPLHSTGTSDFSVGGGIGVSNESGGDGDADFHLEAGAQIRAFVVSNVALSTSVGFGLVVDEGDDALGLGAQLTGAMGVTYFFQ